ncbi:MAG: phosphotransferase [Patescibacteria group bacterium]
MNKIWQLFDEAFVLDYFRRKLLPLYPAFKEIKRVEIKPYKKLIWETTYHVVIGFNVYFLAKGKKEIKIPIICSAHSDEARENVFIGLNYLWEKKINRSGIDLPRPLFFSHHFNGTFYRALNGENLLHYIINKDRASIEKITRESAELFARLHALSVGPEANFNPLNARIQTVIPGTAMIFSEMRARYHGKYTPTLEAIYDILAKREAVFFASGAPLKLIHGDAHPENIIKTGEDRIGLIDFTDLCLSDFARDLGAFIQQVEYKINMKVSDSLFADKIKNIFLETYLDAAGLELDASLRARIDLYYNWTAIRTSTYWFLKAGHNEERGEALLNMVKNNLKI